jgi:hypothetical protein
VIWGGLVPYDRVWRTGANQATAITFSEDVSVEGNKVPAGTYALFSIPGQQEWTIILNARADQWGAFSYNQSEDVLRIKAKPRPCELHEHLTFTFPAVTVDTAQVAVSWEKLQVAFSIKAEATVARVLAAARVSVAEAKPDDGRTPLRAALFCIENAVNLDEAAVWIEKSIAVKETMFNLATKARLLALQGKQGDAIALARRAKQVGKAADPKVDTSMVDALLVEWGR